MRYAILSVLILVAANVAKASADEPRCVCNAANLTRCEGTGPTLLHHYLWSDENRGSQTFDVTEYAPGWTSASCAAASYRAVPHHVPVFNYYGYLVHGCAVVFKNCGLRFAP